jgi:hypothetical protein
MPIVPKPPLYHVALTRTNPFGSGVGDGRGVGDTDFNVSEFELPTFGGLMTFPITPKNPHRTHGSRQTPKITSKIVRAFDFFLG